MLFYGVVSAQTEEVVEFFLERDAAAAMIGEVREDEPALAGDLRVEANRARPGLIGATATLTAARPPAL